MNAIMQNYIEKNFSKAAKSYDDYAVFQYDTAQKIADYISFQPKNILDIGCGTGILSKLLKDKFPNSHLILLDISEDMLLQAKLKMGNDNITYIQQNADNVHIIKKLCMRYDVDLIVSNLCFQWLPNACDLITEYQNLAPCIFSVLEKGSFDEWYQSVQSVEPDFKPPIYHSDYPNMIMLPEYKLSYPSARAFLKAQKYLGTLSHTGTYLAVPELRAICKIFEEKYHAQITYYPSMCVNF